MGCAASGRFGRRPKRPPSPPPGGTRGAADRRRAGDGALVARPGHGSAPNPTALHKPWRKASPSMQRKAALRWAHQGAAAAHLPLRPARAEAASSPPPGGSGPPPLRRRSSGSATRPRVRSKPDGAAQALAKSVAFDTKKSCPSMGLPGGRACAPAASAAGRSGPRARRLAGPGRAPDRRRAGDGALVARPGLGSAPRRGRQRTPGRNAPRGAQESPPVARSAMGRALSRPFGRRPKRPAARRLAGSALVAVASGPGPAGGAAASASPRLAARISPGWRGMRLRARGQVRAHAAEPCSPPRRGGGTTAPSPARRRSVPSRPRGSIEAPAAELSPARSLLLSPASRFGDPALVLRVPPLPGPRGRRRRWQKSSPPKGRAPARRGIGHRARPLSPLRPARAEAASSPPPGGTGAPPLRRRSSGSATRPRVRPTAVAPRKRWQKCPPPSERKARRRGIGNGARALSPRFGGPPKRPRSRIGCLSERSRPRGRRRGLGEPAARRSE